MSIYFSTIKTHLEYTIILFRIPIQTLNYSCSIHTSNIYPLLILLDSIIITQINNNIHEFNNFLQFRKEKEKRTENKGKKGEKRRVDRMPWPAARRMW